MVRGSGRSTAPDSGASVEGVSRAGLDGVSTVGSGGSVRARPRFGDVGWLGTWLGSWLGVEFAGAFRGALLFSAFGCAGCGCRGSRPRKTRERRKSSSSVTPGVRSAAPVGRSNTSGKRRPRTPSVPSAEGTFPNNVAGRRGRFSTSGVESTTRRATGSSVTGRPSEPLPKSRRGTRVTPRQFL